MAADSEVLEELIVKLTADVDKYLKGMDEAQKKTKEVAEKIEHESKRIEEFTEKVKGFGEGIEKSLAVIGVGIGLHEAMEQFEQAEKRLIRLEATLKVNERDVKSLTAEYKAYSAELSKNSELSKGEVLTLFQKAEMYGLTGQKAKEVVKESMALAAAGFGEAESLARAVAMYKEGNVHLLTRMLQLHGITDKMELQEKIQKLINSGMEQQAELAKTSGARIKKMWEEMGKLTKDVGEQVVKALEPIIAKLQELVKWFTSLSKETRETVIQILLFAGSIGPAVLIVSKLLAVLGMSGLLGYMSKFGEAFVVGSEALGRFIGRMELTTKQAWIVRGALYTLAAVAIRSLANELSGTNDRFDKMNERMERAKRLRESFRDKEDKGFTDKKKDIEGTKNIETRIELVDKEIKKAEEKRKMDQESYDFAKKDISERQSSLKGFAAWAGGFVLGKDPFAEENASLKAMGETIQRDTEKLKELREIEERAKRDESNPVARKEAEKWVESLREEQETLGQTEDQIKLYKLEKEGLNRVDAETVRAWIEEKKVWEEHKKSMEETTKSIEELAGKVRDLGKSELDLAIAQINRSSLSREEKDLAIEQTRKLFAEKEARESVIDAIKEINKLNDDAITPLETYLDRVDRLNELMESGLLDERAYIKSMEEAEKKLDDAGNAAIKTKSAIQQVNAVLAGSAEAKFLVTSFLNTQTQSQQDNQAKRLAQGYGSPRSGIDNRHGTSQGEQKIVETTRTGLSNVTSAILTLASAILGTGSFNSGNTVSEIDSEGGFTATGFSDIYPD